MFVSQQPGQRLAIAVVQGKLTDKGMNEGAAIGGSSECLDRISRNIGVGKCYMWAKPCMQRHRDGTAVGGHIKTWVR